MAGDNKLTPIIAEMGRALANASQEEKIFLKDTQQQIDIAAKVQEDNFDRRLEFCYTIILNSDKVKNSKLLEAAKKYIKAVEEG